MITERDLAEATGEPCDVAFEVESLGLAGDRTSVSKLVFLDQLVHLDSLRSTPNVVVVLCAPSLVEDILSLPGVLVIPVADPRWSYYRLHNHLCASRPDPAPSNIHSSAVVSDFAVIAPRGVQIGQGTVVEAGSVILENVVIGDNCVIRAGAVIGSSGFEHKRTSQGVLAVVHDGVLVIEDDVEIGANSVVAQGFVRRPTRLGSQTRLDANVMIAHGVQLGAAVFVAGGTSIAGSVTVGDESWIGVGATIIDRIEIGSRANIGAGSVVFRPVASGTRVLGNPARPVATKVG